MGGGGSVAALNTYSNAILFSEHSSTLSASCGAEEHIQEVEEPLHVLGVEEGRLQKCVQLHVEVLEVPGRGGKEKRKVLHTNCYCRPSPCWA